MFERFIDEKKMYDRDTAYVSQNIQRSANKEQQKKELRQCKQRITEIENLYAKLYEDMTRELITEKHFQMLSARYDSEQEELTAKVKELEKSHLSGIVREYRFQNMEEFYRAFKKSKTAFESYQIEAQKWEQKYGEKPQSLHDRLKAKEREIWERQTEQPYRQRIALR